MIKRLKAECGANFTSKLEGMMKDVDLSKGVMDDYLEYLTDHPLVRGEGF